MARPRKPRWPVLPKRPYGTGSLSRDQTSGEIRARLPKAVSPTRKSRLFAPDALAEAAAWLDGHLRPAEATASPADTLGNWAGHWHLTYVAPIRPTTTARVYLWALDKLTPLYGISINEVRTSALQTIVGQLAGEIEPPTLLAVIGVWRRCFEAAIDDGLIARNPTRGLQTPPVVSRPPSERRHITPAEVGLLWPAIRGHRFEAAYALMLGCGLRIGEILGLSWEYVDLDGGRAWIERQFTEGVWRPMPKGRNPHWVPLPPAVVAALRRHRAAQAVGAVLVMQSAYGRRALADRDGTPWPWSRATVVSDLADLLEALEIAPATPHAGRHGLASYWLDNGVPPAVVAERLGHANAGITLAVYAHAGADGRQRADELTDRLLGQTAPDGVSAGVSGALSTTMGDDGAAPIE